MRADEINQLHQQDGPVGPCPVTAELASLYETGNVQRWEQLKPHCETCPDCQAELVRLNAIAASQPKPSILKQMVKNFVIGLPVFLVAESVAPWSVAIAGGGILLKKAYDRLERW